MGMLRVPTSWAIVRIQCISPRKAFKKSFTLNKGKVFRKTPGTQLHHVSIGY